MNDTPDEPANMGGAEQFDSAAKTETGGASQLQRTLAELRAENTDLRDKHLRTIAEMENFRRRAEREKMDGMKYAISEFARDAVSIGDNLRRAIEAAQKESRDENPALKTLLEGVEVTERELIKVFERHGVTRFDPIGEKFDPHVHEAMIKVDVPNVPADTVVQVLQAGYKIGDRVLRPAAVIVAKGGSPVKAERPQADVRQEETHTSEMANASEHGGLEPIAHDHDPDVIRSATGVPKGTNSQGGRKDRAGGEKRSSSVTQPVTENSAPIKKDDLISSFGKRLENGS
jgi:molecular chaperone GrpE